MRHPSGRRDSKAFVVVDEDCGLSPSITDSYRTYNGSGPLAQFDSAGLLLSMSEYDKPPQNYNVYDYSPATRPEHGQAYSGFGGHPPFPGQYVSTQAQVPSGLPTALPLVPPVQQYTGTHDPAPAHYGQQYAQHPASAYLEAAPRPLPQVISFTPNQGQQNTTVTVYFQSVYDFDSPPILTFLMFGYNKCQSVLRKTERQGQMYQYALTAKAPPFMSTSSPSPVPLHLSFDDASVAWESPSLELGCFTYLDTTPYYPTDSPQATDRKRKLSPQASPRRSPTKKPTLQQIPGPTRTQAVYPTHAIALTTPSSPFRRPSLPDAYGQTRRFSSAEYQHPAYSAPLPDNQQYYGSQMVQNTPALQPGNSPSWAYHQGVQSTTRSPSTTPMSVVGRIPHLIPSPTNMSNPPLIRTSTIQQSPSTPGSVTMSTPTFNPYSVMPPNCKAVLQIDGDLNTMADKWAPAEWEVSRRLVQFRRSQSGSIIKATFEAVTPETRIPNSICVSCIWWAEKQECYVTSVDTISLLESLVGVRFTVEEKNRIRRNLEGFRPATVSKAKADSEEFFKLIMGFPTPKPRNIEKDVKVFPWRILTGALKKIIGKYSASWSSTAGALHPAGSSYTTAPRASDAGMEHPRSAASPLSTASSTTSHGHAAHGYASAMATNSYSPHVPAPSGLGIGPPAGLTDLRLAGPVSAASQTTSWHQPSTNYSHDLSSTGAFRTPSTAWDFGGNYMTSSPITGMPGSAQAFQYQPAHRYPSVAGLSAMPNEARIMPLQSYDEQGHSSSTA